MIGIYPCRKYFADTDISVEVNPHTRLFTASARQSLQAVSALALNAAFPIALLRKSGDDVLINPPPAGTPPKTGGESY